MLDELFTFPIVMIDGDNEERKMKNKPDLGLASDDEDEEYDMVFGEAEYPCLDFIGIEDRWLPSTDSLKKALDGKFDACLVRFLHAGSLLVPWTKKKFKTEIKKFIDSYEVNNPRLPQIKITALTAEQYKEQMENGEPKE